MPETIEQRMRRWLLEEATRNGPEVHTTSGPSVATTWRYPHWPAHDVAWEERTMTKPFSLDGQAIVEALREQNEILRGIASSLDSIDRGIFDMNAEEEA